MSVKLKILAGSMLMTSIACNQTATEDAAADLAKKDETSTATESSVVKVDKIANLNLSGALQLQLPSAIATDGSASLLALGDKSLEACLIRESINQSKMMLDGITGILCHVEAESANIEVGKPKLFKLAGMGLRLQAPPTGMEGEIPEGMPTSDPTASASSMPDPTAGGSTPPSGAEAGAGAGAPAGAGGDQYIGVSITKTDTSMDVYVCEGSAADSLKLSQHFKIEGSKTITKDGKEVGASKGEMRLSFDMGGITFGANVKYDAFHTDPEIYDSEFRVKLSGDMGGGMGLSSTSIDMSQLMKLKLSDSGVSTVALADRGEMMGFSSKNATIGKFDSDHGHVVGSFDTQSFDSKVKACVDKNSVLVACDEAKFLEGGALAVAATEVPSFLPADFEAAKPKGFDCDIEWGTATTMDPASAAHEACAMDPGEMTAPSCFTGSEFVASGIEAPDVPDDIPDVVIPDETTEATVPIAE